VSHAPLAQLGRGFITLGAGEIAARVVAFLAAAYISKTIGAANFGVVGFALAAMLYAQRIVGWELESLGAVEVAAEGEAGDLASGTLLLMRAVIAGIVMCVAAIIGALFLPEIDGRVFLRYAIGLVFVALNARFIYLMRHRPGPPAAARLIAEMAAALLVVLLVRTPDDVGKVPVGFIVGEALASLLLLAGLGGARIFRGFDRQLARRVFRQAVPLVLSSLLGIVVFNLDLIMLRFIRGAESAGYYAAAYALVGLITNIGIAYYLNVVPGLSRLREDRAAFQRLYNSAATLCVVLALPMAVGGVILARPLILTVFGAGYAPAATPLMPLVIAACLTIFRFVPQASIVASGRRRDVLWVNIIGAVLNAVLNVLLIPPFGILGAATSTLTTDVVRTGVALHLSGRAGVRNDFVWNLWRSAGAAMAMGLVVWAIRSLPIWVTIPAGVVVYGGGLLAFGAVRWGGGRRLELVS
jgi:O-antigen/teichoic acid export membrane protein